MPGKNGKLKSSLPPYIPPDKGNNVGPKKHPSRQCCQLECSLNTPDLKYFQLGSNQSFKKGEDLITLKYSCDRSGQLDPFGKRNKSTSFKHIRVKRDHSLPEPFINEGTIAIKEDKVDITEHGFEVVISLNDLDNRKAFRLCRCNRAQCSHRRYSIYMCFDNGCELPTASFMLLGKKRTSNGRRDPRSAFHELYILEKQGQKVAKQHSEKVMIGGVKLGKNINISSAADKKRKTVIMDQKNKIISAQKASSLFEANMVHQNIRKEKKMYEIAFPILQKPQGRRDVQGEDTMHVAVKFPSDVIMQAYTFRMKARQEYPIVNGMMTNTNKRVRVEDKRIAPISVTEEYYGVETADITALASQEEEKMMRQQNTVASAATAAVGLPVFKRRRLDMNMPELAEMTK